MDKLKLNGGDFKAVQGDSGHSQINMVTDVYSHIIDDDRRKKAELFEQAFYEKKNLDPSMHANVAGKTVELPTNVDAEFLAKVLSNPEMATNKYESLRRLFLLYPLYPPIFKISGYNECKEPGIHQKYRVSISEI